MPAISGCPAVTAVRGTAPSSSASLASGRLPKLLRVLVRRKKRGDVLCYCGCKVVVAIVRRMPCLCSRTSANRLGERQLTHHLLLLVLAEPLQRGLHCWRFHAGCVSFFVLSAEYKMRDGVLCRTRQPTIEDMCRAPFSAHPSSVCEVTHGHNLAFYHSLVSAGLLVRAAFRCGPRSVLWPITIVQSTVGDPVQNRTLGIHALHLKRRSPRVLARPPTGFQQDR